MSQRMEGSLMRMKELRFWRFDDLQSLEIGDAVFQPQRDWDEVC